MKKSTILVATIIILLLSCATSNKIILGDGTEYQLKLASNGLTNPSSNSWATIEMAGAGLEFDEIDGKDVAFTVWNLGFKRKSKNVKSVQISEVSGKSEIVLIEKQNLDEKENDFKFFGVDKKRANKEESRWLFWDNTTIRIYKFEFFDIDGKSKVLYQPSVITSSNKKIFISMIKMRTK